MNFKHYMLIACCLLAVAFNASAQAPSDTVKYNHSDLFGPISWPTTSNGTRSAAGKPGPNYWQNRADYLIHTTLDEGQQDTTVSGDVAITYTNNSPDNMDYVWLQLDQNLFSPD